MKKVWLLGDSIRLSYTARVKELLEGRADIFSPEENGRFARYTLWQICRGYQSGGTPDIVHWNNGIWDLHRLQGDGGAFTSLEEYGKDLRRVLAALRQRSAGPVIWASTTPVNQSVYTAVLNSDIELYNRVAGELMLSEGVEVNDLHALITAGKERFLSEDGVHLSPGGVEAAAKAVVKILEKYQ